MSEYKELLVFSRPDFVTELLAVRSQEQGSLNVTLKIDAEGFEKQIFLSGFEELADALGDLFKAETVIISREINSGKEFGSVKIECWADECYSEYFCDLAKQ
jgi:hypothetical protein